MRASARLPRVAMSTLGMVALVGGLISCATTEGPVDEDTASDSKPTEIADLKFRGRWWSYYDRAVLYLQSDMFEQARTDLLHALSKRATDQRWPRTYGLHFMPEYFPNRELGICHYFEGRPEESIRYLEKSLEDYFTARGAYYLNLAREQVVSAAGEDHSGPIITLLSPNPDAVLPNPFVELHFRVEDDTYVRSVSVNGVDIPLRVSNRALAERFEIEVLSGINTIEIQATDIVGNRTGLIQALRSDLDGPTVSFDAPPARPGRLSGVIVDDSDIEYMRIGDVSAVLTAGDGRVVFKFDSAFEPDAEFKCADVLGNVTRGRLANASSAVAVSRASSSRRLPVEHAKSDGTFMFAASVEEQVDPPNFSSPRIEFTNLREGQRYLQPEVVVGLLVGASNSIAAIEINGAFITQLLPERRVQHVTSKIAMEELGIQEIVATASDLDGRSFQTRVSIERALPAVYEISNRLSLAVVGSLWRSGAGDESSLRDYLATELPRALRDTNRFRILDRDSLGKVLQEQELVAALGSPEERRNLGQLELADYLLVADVRRFQSNLEVLVHAIEPSSGRDIVMDVYGPATSSEQLQGLLEILALRVYQEFPRVQGEVISVLGGGARVRTTVQRNDRVRESASCLLYREKELVDVETGQFLGVDLQPVASGVFTSIGGSRSTVTINSAANESAEETDLVITR